MCQEAEKCLRQQVPSLARKYIGCRYLHQGRDNQAGIDCIGLVLKVAEDLGLKNQKGQPIIDLDLKTYARLGGAGGKLVNLFEDNMIQIDAPREGCVILFKIIKSPQHVALIGEKEGNLTMIHSYQPAGKVTENYLSDKWLKRVIGIYDFHEVYNG